MAGSDPYAGLGRVVGSGGAIEGPAYDLQVPKTQADINQSGASATKSLTGAASDVASTQRTYTLTPLQAKNLEADINIKQNKNAQIDWQRAHGNLTGKQYADLKDRRKAAEILAKLVAKHTSDYNANFANQGLGTLRELLPSAVNATNARYDSRAKIIFPWVTKALGLTSKSIDTAKEQELYSTYIPKSKTFDIDAEERLKNLADLVNKTNEGIAGNMNLPQPGARPPLSSFFKPQAK